MNNQLIVMIAGYSDHSVASDATKRLSNENCVHYWFAIIGNSEVSNEFPHYLWDFCSLMIHKLWIILFLLQRKFNFKLKSISSKISEKIFEGYVE